MISKNKSAGKPMCQNQLQFNLGIPLTTQNLVTHFHHPSPIMIERIGGHSAIPGGVKQPAKENLNASAVSSCNFSVLSEEKMTRMSQLAQRNLKNMKLKEKSSEPRPAQHPLVQGRHKFASNVTCSRQRRDAARKASQSTRSKEVAKNRPVGDVPTPRPKRSLVSHNPAESQHVPPASNVDIASKKQDTFFPIKAAGENKKAEAPKGELGKIQTEIENSLTILKQIAERAISVGTTNFLQPLLKGKERDGFLYEEEGLDRARHRSEEHNIRFSRTLYNLRQRVKHLQREVTQADLNIPTQKRHIHNQLVVMYRHVSQALHTFLNNLPFQDLTHGLPAHYSELNLMIQQLTVLTKVLTQESDQDGQTNILHILDDVDEMNSKWSSQSLHTARQALPDGKRNAIIKEWVSDTKVEADIFAKMESALGLARHPSQRPSQHHQPHKKPPQRGRAKRRAPGKENKSNQDKRVPSKTGRSALSGQSQVGFVPVGSTKVQPAPSVAWEVNLGKGVMLPTNLIAQREKAQRAVELSRQNEPNFCESTASSRLKSSSRRPSSAPASQSRRKEVNFDLEHKSLLPWIPAGSGPYRPRSASLEHRSGSKEMETQGRLRQESLNYSPRMGSLKMPGRDRGDSREYGFLSLPPHQHNTRSSHPVTDSFLESVEQRLFDRMMQRKVDNAPQTCHPDLMGQSLRQQDKALDITDLYVEDDSSLNDTRAKVKEMARQEAVGMVDAPTLENIKLRLDDMQRKQQEIRARWSTIKFADSRPLTRKTAHDYPPEPGLLHVEKDARQEKDKPKQSDFNKSCHEDPLLFTKAYLSHQSRQRTRPLPSAPSKAPTPKPKQLVSMKQTVVERLVADRDKFESYLHKKSHHPSGKFDPWTLVEEISDAILMDCLQDVSEEVEKINEEIANHMYKSEFMVSSSPSSGTMMTPLPEFPTIAQEGPVQIPAIDFQQVMENAHPQAGVLQDGPKEDTIYRRPVVASEPLLEDISQFMSNRMEEREERSKTQVTDLNDIVNEGRQANGQAVQDDEGDDEDVDEEYEEEDDDEDDDNYSDDDFEDVSDVEL